MEKNKIGNTVTRLLTGWGSSMVVLLASGLFLAYVIEGDKLGEDMQPYGFAAAILAASAIGSAVFMRSKKSAAAGILFALVLSLSLLGMTAIFFDSAFRGVAVTLLLIVGGSLIPLFTGRKRKKNSWRSAAFALYR